LNGHGHNHQAFIDGGIFAWLLAFSGKRSEERIGVVRFVNWGVE
jgi:hypothetical protein